MAEENTITPEGFSLLLGWLDADAESAAEKYESIRKRLIRIFAGRGCHEAEILADQTIDRVTLKVPNIKEAYVGDPAIYFYGVAGKIHLEWLRRQKPTREISPQDAQVDIKSDDDREGEYACLEKCLDKIESGLREMIIEYYRDEKRAKIERRKKLAEQMGITIGALQIKTSRVRSRLLECVRGCVAGN